MELSLALSFWVGFGLVYIFFHGVGVGAGVSVSFFFFFETSSCFLAVLLSCFECFSPMQTSFHLRYSFSMLGWFCTCALSWSYRTDIEKFLALVMDL